MRDVLHFDGEGSVCFTCLSDERQKRERETINYITSSPFPAPSCAVKRPPGTFGYIRLTACSSLDSGVYGMIAGENAAKNRALGLRSEGIITLALMALASLCVGTVALAEAPVGAMTPARRPMGSSPITASSASPVRIVIRVGIPSSTSGSRPRIAWPATAVRRKWRIAPGSWM